MPDFIGLTPELCDRAFHIVRPAINGAAALNLTPHLGGHMVVMNPRIPREPKYQEWMIDDPDHPFEKLVLWEKSLGERAHWSGPFDQVARAKAYASWKTGLPTRLINQAAPYLYQFNWTKWPGSAVGLGGFVVAFSGDRDYYDEMYSEMMLAAVKAVCMDSMHNREHGVMQDSDITFLGTRSSEE